MKKLFVLSFAFSVNCIFAQVTNGKWISDSNYLIVIGAGVIISMLLGKTLASSRVICADGSF